MDEFCLHQMPTANLTLTIANPHLQVKAIAPNTPMQAFGRNQKGIEKMAFIH
jgi:hypothetical protein